MTTIISSERENIHSIDKTENCGPVRDDDIISIIRGHTRTGNTRLAVLNVSYISLPQTKNEAIEMIAQSILQKKDTSTLDTSGLFEDESIRYDILYRLAMRLSDADDAVGALALAGQMNETWQVSFYECACQRRIHKISESGDKFHNEKTDHFNFFYQFLNACAKIDMEKAICIAHLIPSFSNQFLLPLLMQSIEQGRFSFVHSNFNHLDNFAQRQHVQHAMVVKLVEMNFVVDAISFGNCILPPEEQSIYFIDLLIELIKKKKKEYIPNLIQIVANDPFTQQQVQRQFLTSSVIETFTSYTSWEVTFFLWPLFGQMVHNNAIWNKYVNKRICVLKNGIDLYRDEELVYLASIQAYNGHLLDTIKIAHYISNPNELMNLCSYICTMFSYRNQENKISEFLQQLFNSQNSPPFSDAKMSVALSLASSCVQDDILLALLIKCLNEQKLRVFSSYIYCLSSQEKKHYFLSTTAKWFAQINDQNQLFEFGDKHLTEEDRNYLFRAFLRYPPIT